MLSVVFLQVSSVVSLSQIIREVYEGYDSLAEILKTALWMFD